MFTDAPLPPASDRPIPPGAIMGQRRRPSLQTKGSDSWTRRGSIAAQKTPTRDRRPSLARNASASTSTIPLLSPTGPPSQPLFQFEQNYHGPSPSFGEHGQPYPSTSTWVPPPALSSHNSGSILTSPSTQQPTPLSFHYEQVAPVPPPIQYPVEDETAWYQAALNVDPQQQQPPQAYPAYQHAPAQPQDPYHLNPVPQYPAYEGYQDLMFGSTGVPGVGARYTDPVDPHNMNHTPGSSTIYSEPGYEGGAIQQSTSTYARTPGPYASQANLAVQTTPMSMPIYNTHYATPAVDIEGHRPGMTHEGTYPGMGYQIQEQGYMSPSIPHPALYQEETTQSTRLHHVQPAPYTFPHLPIPLPEYERPTIARSASNPNNSMHLTTSETPSEGSLPTTTTTTTVSVAVPEGEYYPQNMNVCYPDEVSSCPGSGTKNLDKLTERLGEFFLGPEKKEEVGNPVDIGGERHIKKSRKSVSASGGADMSYRMQESDGLTEGARNAL